MTATERLRAMLDERGVEWVDTGDGSTLIPEQTATDVAWDVNTWPSGKDMGDCLWVQNRHPLTPEQAIEATLGRGECELLGYDDGVDEAVDGEWVQYAPPRWFLSCGHEVEGSEKPNYCPSCGKKVRA